MLTQLGDVTRVIVARVHRLYVQTHFLQAVDQMLLTGSWTLLKWFALIKNHKTLANAASTSAVLMENLRSSEISPTVSQN